MVKNCSILGLVGGIGSGKSTVAALLAQKGMIVLDADQLAGELLQDPDVCKEIRDCFGDDVFNTKGKIDRALLSNRVFESEDNRSKINAIIHPKVRAQIRRQVEAILTATPGQLIVFDIPLLVGSELRSMCDLVVMVRASLKTRLQRVVKDRGWKKGELKRREAYQPSIEEKEAEADVVINNNGSLEDLEREIESFLQYIQNINRN